MADRTVGSLPRAPDLYDDSLLVIQQQGAAMSLEGAQLKGFARQGVEAYVADAQKAVQDAKDAVKDAESCVTEAQAAAQEARAAVGDAESAVEDARKVVVDAESAAQDARAAAGEAQTAQEGAEAARKAVEDLEVEAAALPFGQPASAEKTAKEGHVLLRFGLPAGERGPRGDTGSSIQKIERTAGTGAAGTVDTYTVTLTDGSTSTFQVRNGADGKGVGDMTAAVYDPQRKARDVFAYADALLPAVHALTLTADGWTGDAAPYGQTLPVPGVLMEEERQVVQLSIDAGSEDWSGCGVSCTAQGAGTLTFTAQERPGADIRLHVAVQAARKGGETM